MRPSSTKDALFSNIKSPFIGIPIPNLGHIDKMGRSCMRSKLRGNGVVYLDLLSGLPMSLKGFRNSEAKTDKGHSVKFGLSVHFQLNLGKFNFTQNLCPQMQTRVSQLSAKVSEEG